MSTVDPRPQPDEGSDEKDHPDTTPETEPDESD